MLKSLDIAILPSPFDLAFAIVTKCDTIITIIVIGVD
jgi:hypothetical protein